MTENSNSKPIRTSRDEVIIDGVDVKNCKGIDLGLFPLCKCKFLKFKTSDDGIAGIWCSDHTNCYFKQLTRKTQECEELKKDRINIIKEDAKDYRKLQQAEQKLKRIKQVCKDYCKIMCLCETKETCESCINTEILQIIDEVE